MAPTAVSAGPIGAFAIRLAALGGVFALAVLVELRGSGEYTGREVEALYALVVAGLLQAVAHVLLGLRGRDGPILQRLQAVGDGLLITGLVYCAGGVESFFVFLYDVWVVHVAMRVGARAAFPAAVAAGLSYAAIAFGAATGWIAPFEPGSAGSLDHAIYPVVLQCLGFAFVAGLSYALAEQIEVGREELHELGELYRRIFDHVSSGLLTVSEERAITSFNREAERITGFAAEEVIGQPLEKVFAGRSGEQVLAPRPLSAQRPVLVFEDREGNARHLGFSSSVLRNARDEAEGAVVIFQDLTRVVEMEDQLRRSERLGAVGQLAAGLAHEIRNPLGSLSGAIELLSADRAFEDEHSRRLFRIVQREAQRLNRLVSEFLEYARTGPGRRQAVPLRPLFEEMVQLLRGGEHRELEVALQIVEPAAAVGDPDRLRQVFWNLLINAAQSQSRDRRIEVRIRPAPQDASGVRRVEVAIEDHGQGIPPEHLEHVFEPFFTTKPKGTGLGLATVHRLVEAAGGSVQLHSEPGRGTVARVVLLAEEVAGGAGTAPAIPSPERARGVLP